MLQKSFALLLTAILLFGCASTSEITNTWIKPQANTAGIHTIMVLAMVGENRDLRQQMEQALVNQLRNTGYTAYSSYTEYGPKMFDSKNEEAALQQIKDKNVDAVLTIVLLDKDQERYYVPGNVQYTPYAVYYNRFWGYYSTLYDRTYSPGYYSTSTNYFWENNLYNAKTNDLIYSAQTKSFNPTSASKLAAEYGKLIVNDMTKNGVLVRQSTAAR